MPEQTKKLAHFIQAVELEATAEAERALDALEAQKAAALDYASRAARQDALRQIRAETARIRTEAGRQVSLHLMDCKREVYLRRAQIAEQVFDQVRERIRAFTASPDYPARLEAQLTQAVGRFGLVAEVTVYLRREDMDFSAALARAIKPVAARFEAGSFTLGGLIVDCPEIGQRIDGCYDDALEELSGRFAELFGLSLTDDLSDTGKEAAHG